MRRANEALWSCFLAASLASLATGCGRWRSHHGGGGDDAPTAVVTTPAPKPAPPPTPPLAAADQPTNDGVADFRGYFAVDDLIRQRLTTPDFVLGAYLGQDGGDLATLLGFGFGDGQHSQFQNGKANAINLVIWHMVLAGVAEDLAKSCDPAAGTAPITADTAGHAEARAEISKVIAPLCAWPAPAARNADNLAALWAAVMEQDAPPAEYDAFRDFALGPDLAHSPAKDAVSGLLTAMFLNPHFLIRQ